MPKPLVSVLTPSFNQGRWLRDNLQSVANQTYANIEHVVVDGGSHDSSIEILSNSCRPIWISEPDEGQSNAINKALALSSGEILGWLNSDDAYWDARVIERVVDFFERNPQVDVVYGHSALVNASGLLLHMIWVPPFSYSLLRQHNFIIQPAAFVRRRVLVGGWLVDERFESAMDRELWLRLGKSAQFKRIDAILAIDRHHPLRKAYTRNDLAASDFQLLRKIYGVPSGTIAWISLRTLAIAFRLAGLSLIRCAKAEKAFHSKPCDRRSLIVRQAGRRRKSMPAYGSR